MSNSNSSSRNRMVMLLIGGIPLTIILVATWVWFFVVRGDLDLIGIVGTANRGTLVQPPRQLDDQTLHGPLGESVKLAELDPRWSMLIPVAGRHCGEACEESLYMTRQIRTAMGKSFNRLRRLYISDVELEDTILQVNELSDGRPAEGGIEFVDYLAREHQGLQTMTLPRAQYKELFPEYALDASTWYLVDPAGWVMMSYNSGVSYKDVIADLKFLLKNSGG